MFYSDLVYKASKISFEAHKDDVDKGGYPYVYHPAYLAFQMDDEITTCVALLHDVIEDHGDVYSFEMLEQMGFYPEIITALKALTHGEDEPYERYIERVKTNEYATKVKIADLNHNLISSRIGGAAPKKQDKYLNALAYLQDAPQMEQQ